MGMCSAGNGTMKKISVSDKKAEEGDSLRCVVPKEQTPGNVSLLLRQGDCPVIGVDQEQFTT